MPLLLPALSLPPLLLSTASRWSGTATSRRGDIHGDDPPCRRSLHDLRLDGSRRPHQGQMATEGRTFSSQRTSSGPAEGRRFTGPRAGPGGSGPSSTPHHAGPWQGSGHHTTRTAWSRPASLFLPCKEPDARRFFGRGPRVASCRQEASMLSPDHEPYCARRCRPGAVPGRRVDLAGPRREAGKSLLHLPRRAAGHVQARRARSSGMPG
jgi:hypothetical protein